MRTFVFLTLLLCATIAQGQYPCENVKLYDQMLVIGDQPMLHKLRRFDKKLIPDSTLLKMKNEIIQVTSPKFFSGLKIKSVKLFDSAVARAGSWIYKPIVNNKSNPVYFFYAVLFETKTTNGTPFVFRLDVLKNGELLNIKQIAFYRKSKLEIIGCKKLSAIVLTDTIQPIHSIDYMALAYSSNEQVIIWSVASIEDPKTGIHYCKEVNAVTGEIIRRYSYKKELMRLEPVELEEVKIQTDN